MACYSAASSSLLLVNKLCLRRLPLPSLVSSLQFVATVVAALGAMCSGSVKPDYFEWRKVKPYLLYVVLFCTTIYCNMMALQHSNVETIIVFRACCPLVVSVLEWTSLGRTLPSRHSALALLILLFGCAGFVATDHAFKMKGLKVRDRAGAARKEGTPCARRRWRVVARGRGAGGGSNARGCSVCR